MTGRNAVVERVTQELGVRFPTIAAGRVHAETTLAVRALSGSVHPHAMPEMAAKLVRLRLVGELLDGDAESAARMCAATTWGELGAVVQFAARRALCDAVEVRLADGASPPQDGTAGAVVPMHGPFDEPFAWLVARWPDGRRADDGELSWLERAASAAGGSWLPFVDGLRGRRFERSID